MNASPLAASRSIAITSIALAAGPIAVLLVAGARGRWMWDQTRDGAPMWRLDHWLVDPWIVGSFALGVVLIAMVEARGGSQAQRFRQAIRLAPIAFAVPVAAVAISDPVLPEWVYWRMSSFGTASDPRQLHEIVLTLATPCAFVGTLLPAWWLGTRPRSQADLASPAQRIILAVKVYLAGYLGATLFTSVPPVGTLFSILFGIPAAGLLLGLLMLPGLVVSVWLWAGNLTDQETGDDRPASRRWEFAAFVGCGLLAFGGFTFMKG